jgi:hypothetical protein
MYMSGNIICIYIYGDIYGMDESTLMMRHCPT